MQMDELPREQQMSDDCTPSLADELVAAEAELDAFHSWCNDWEEPLTRRDDAVLTRARTAMEAAAVAVRERDALRAAIEAHREDFRRSHYTGSIPSWPCDEALWAALEAVPVPERPERCPRCGSDDRGDRYGNEDGTRCPDSFHTPPSAPEEPTDDDVQPRPLNPTEKVR